MKKNKHYIAEQFDFNNVLDNSNSNDEIINNISNTLALDSIINVIKNTFETTHDYKFSKFTISDDKRIIVVNTTLIYSDYQQLQTRFIINEDNTIYVDYIDGGSNKDVIKITKLISQILQNIQKLLVTPCKCKIRIITPYYISTYNSDINGLTTLHISYSKVCFIIGMVKNGYKDISILTDNMGLTTVIDKNNLQYYDFGNILINKGSIPMNSIDNNIIKDFIEYVQFYMLPEDGYVLFRSLPPSIYNDTAPFFTYFNKVALCKFNDKETLSTMQHTKFKITDAEVKLMCKNFLFKNTENLDKTINKLTAKITLDKLDKFYVRIVLASILSGNIYILENYNKYMHYFKNALDPTLLKAYYNYVIDDIRNYGPIYKQIVSYNV